METLFIGRQLRYLQEVESTNSHLLKRLNKPGMAEGAAIWTLNQTRGKGQPGNTWHSHPGAGLAISYFFRPTFISASQGYIFTQAVSLAVCDTLNVFLNQRAQIKWPNDILVDRKKICGILIESQVRGAQLGEVVVGIGVNLKKAAVRSVGHGVSFEELGQIVDPGDLIEILSLQLERRYFQLKNNSDQLLIDFEDKLFGKDDYLKYHLRGEEVELMVVGVDNTGRVVMKNKKGRTFTFSLKEISFSYL